MSAASQRFLGNGVLGQSLGPRESGYKLPEAFVLHPSARFSFEMWFVSSHASGNQMLFDSRQAGGDEHGIYAYMTADGRIRVAAKDDSGPTTKIVSTHGQYHNGIWHHLMVSVDGACQLRVYLDGIEQRELDRVNTPFLVPFASTPEGRALLAAPQGSGPFQPWQGRLDEVRYWFDPRSQPSVRAAMCQILKPRARPLETTSIRLGAYVWKGAMHCMRRWIAQSFDLVSSRIGTYRERAFGGATTERSLRSYDASTILLLQSTPVLLPKKFAHRYPRGPSQSIAAAQLRRECACEVVSRHYDTHYQYDPAHPVLASTWVQFLEKRFLRTTPSDHPDDDLNLDGVIADDMPLGGADRWSKKGEFAANIGMRAAKNPPFIYDGSITRRLLGTVRFIEHLHEHRLTGRVLGVNVTHHELGAGFGDQLIEAGLQVAWLEQWVRSYASNEVDGGKTPTARLRDIEMAEKLSASGIPTLAAGAFVVGNARSLENLIAFYLLAKQSDSLKLHPMPIEAGTGSFSLSDFGSLNAHATEGFSAHYLFERLKDHRPMLERHFGDSREVRTPLPALGQWTFRREYANGVAFVNLGDTPIFVRESDLRPRQEQFRRTLSGEGVSFPFEISPASGVVFVR